MSSSTNRDIVRQNKANSVVVATIYSQISQYGLECIVQECERLSSNVHDESSLQTALNNIKAVASTCHSATSTASRLYMKCSTHIKLGAKEIANNENSVLKKAIRFKEFDNLQDDMDHFDQNMLDMHKEIAKCTI